MSSSDDVIPVCNCRLVLRIYSVQVAVEVERVSYWGSDVTLKLVSDVSVERVSEVIVERSLTS